MNKKTFVFEDQNKFAFLSGDFNPLHLDPIVSRRLLFGSMVVHGLHTLLWGLDNLVSINKEQMRLTSVFVRFQNVIRVGNTAICVIDRKSDNSAEINIYNKNELVTFINVVWQKEMLKSPEYYINEAFDACLPDELTEEEYSTASGSINLYLNISLLNTLFVDISKYINLNQIASLLSTTRIVGMKCPGLHSIYSSLECHFEELDNKTPNISYKVKKMHKGSGQILINIESSIINGTIKAFRRPQQVKQIRFNEMKQLGFKGDFKNQKALIIGGSRGLGEVTAKILAAGGADVHITYCHGKLDALRVVEEISNEKFIAECFNLNILDEKVQLPYEESSKWVPTHVYYFATPYIKQGKDGIFSEELFKYFYQYYVIGFENVINKLKSLGIKKVFYPSTIFINSIQSGMCEYAMAKVAGEMFCNYYSALNGEVTIFTPRLPKMLTDQTTSIIPMNLKSPVELMNEYLIKFNVC